MTTYFYLGRTPAGGRIVFKCDTTPTRASHGDKFNSVVGPFRTKRAAMFMMAFGHHNNPHLQQVSDAERLAKPCAR